jgi:hypothetical protein
MGLEDFTMEEESPVLEMLLVTVSSKSFLKGSTKKIEADHTQLLVLRMDEAIMDITRRLG